MCLLLYSASDRTRADTNVIVWTIFVFTFLVASINSNIVFILIYLFVDLGFLLIAASYFAKADAHINAATGLQKAGGASCFVAGLLGWCVLRRTTCTDFVNLTADAVNRYLTFHLLLKEELLELPLGDTSKYFKKRTLRN